MQEWVKVQVCADAGPIVRIGQMMIIAMDDVHIPPHKTHLKPQNGRVATVVRQDEFDCIAIGYPNEAMAVAQVMAFVDRPVPSETFAEMGVQSCFVSSSSSRTERDGT